MTYTHSYLREREFLIARIYQQPTNFGAPPDTRLLLTIRSSNSTGQMLFARISFRLPLAGQTLGFGDLRSSHLLRHEIPVLEAHGITAGCRQAKTHIGLYVILRNTLSLSVQDAEIGLGLPLSVIRRLAIPLFRLIEVLVNARTLVI